MGNFTGLLPGRPLFPAGRAKRPSPEAKGITAKRWAVHFVLTLLGFAVAIAVNRWGKQVADVAIKTYTVAGFSLTFNTLYRLVLGGLMLFYTLAGLFSFGDPVRRDRKSVV